MAHEMLLQGKTALVAGLANRNSIAWGITQSLIQHGVERIAFSYQPRFEANVRTLVENIPGALLVPADVSDDASLDGAFAEIDREFGGLDIMVHSIAAAKPADLDKSLANTSRDGFLFAQEISAYSLIELSRRAAPLMEKNGGGSIICLTYLGGQRVVENYNVMGVAKASLEMTMRYLAADLGPRGIRVNALSPAPINTISARAVTGIRGMFTTMEERSPLRRNVTLDDVGNTVVFFLSDLSRAVTGQVLFVDNGYSILGI